MKRIPVLPGSWTCYETWMSRGGLLAPGQVSYVTRFNVPWPVTFQSMHQGSVSPEGLPSLGHLCHHGCVSSLCVLTRQEPKPHCLISSPHLLMRSCMSFWKTWVTGKIPSFPCPSLHFPSLFPLSHCRGHNRCLLHVTFSVGSK